MSSILDALLNELETLCHHQRLDFEKYKNIVLRTFGNENPLLYCFGVGMAPENPLALIDLMVVTENLVFAFSFSQNSSSSSITRRTEVHTILIESTNEKVKISLFTHPLGAGYYLNNYPDKINRVYKFSEDLRNLIMHAQWQISGDVDMVKMYKVVAGVLEALMSLAFHYVHAMKWVGYY